MGRPAPAAQLAPPVQGPVRPEQRRLGRAQRGGAGRLAANALIILSWAVLAAIAAIGIRLGRGLPAVEWQGVVLLSLYVGFFARTGLWLLSRDLWWRRPNAAPGSELPSIGLLVLTPDDPELIAQTVRRLAFLDYPRQRLEALLLIDGSERRLVEQRQRALTETLSAMAEAASRHPRLPADRQALVGWLQRLFDEPEDLTIRFVYETMAARAVSDGHLRAAARGALASYSFDQERQVPGFLDEIMNRHGRSLQAFRLLAGRRAEARLPALTLDELYLAIRARPRSSEPSVPPPGGKAAVGQVAAGVGGGSLPANLRIMVVPACYGESCLGGEASCPGPAACAGSRLVSKPSKGRTLNWARRRFSQCDLIGIYDAACRPPRDALQLVARQWSRCRSDQERQTFFTRGPLFPIQNFYRLDPAPRSAALYQTIVHDVFYPAWMTLFPLPADSNLFIAPQLVESLGGFAPEGGAEKGDFALRVWQRTGIRPSFLPSAASEGSPPTVAATMRQREQWAFGYLDALRLVWHQRRWWTLGLMLAEGPFQWLLGFGLFLAGPGALLLILTGLMPMAGGLSLLAAAVVVVNLPFLVLLPSWSARYQPWIDLRQRPHGFRAWAAEWWRLLSNAPFLLLMMWPLVQALVTYQPARRSVG